MTLFDRIKKIAKSKGYSLSEVSRQSGIGEKSIYTWKPSKTYPDGIIPKHDTLQKVADVLGVSVDYLLGNTDDMHKTKNEDPSTPELIAAHWGIDLSELSDEEKGFVMGRAQDYVKGLVDAIEGRK